MHTSFTTYYSCAPVHLRVTASALVINEVCYIREEEIISTDPLENQPLLLQQCITELDEYFAGNRRSFQVPVEQQGTAFQKRVWQELLKIPYGSTISYLELSRRIGDVKAIRAAASTNGKNRIAVIVPCHRVIGSDRSLVGYTGGLNNKRWLLDHELKYAGGVQSLF